MLSPAKLISRHYARTSPPNGDTERNSQPPSMFTQGSNARAWWICEAGHSWDMPIKRRTAGQGCPVCAGKRVIKGVNDLATLKPELASEWDTDRNERSPDAVTLNSGYRAFWTCSNGHHWAVRVAQRTGKGSGCPVCSGRIQAGVNDLGTTHPELIVDWNQEFNDIEPHEVTANSNRRVWWICRSNHSWQAMIATRAKHGAGCRQCDGVRRRPVTPGMPTVADTAFADEWSPRNDKEPSEYSRHSRLKAWWRCALEHEWQARISHRHVAGCPTCSGRRTLAGYNDLATTHPDVAKEWHPTLNDLNSDQVGKGCIKQIWWQCSLGHQWQETPNYRTSKESSCPICRGRKLLTGYNDLATCHPELAAQWHPRNRRTADETPAIATQRAWWICGFGHEWKTLISKRIGGHGCPTCGGKRVAQGFNDLSTVRPSIAAQWHPTLNTLRPTEVTYASNRQIWWQCEKKHEWKTSVGKRTAGRECPDCVAANTSRRERAVCAPIANHFNVDYDGPQRVSGCRSALDLALPDLKIAVEYDGWYWHMDAAERDDKKTAQLHAAGWTVIRIRETSRGRELPAVQGILVLAEFNENANILASRVITLIRDLPQNAA